MMNEEVGREDMAADHGAAAAVTLSGLWMGVGGDLPHLDLHGLAGRAQDVRTGWGHLTAFTLALVSCLHKK